MIEDTSILPVYAPSLRVSHGQGTWLFTSENEKYLDFVMGVASNTFGHCHPPLVQALQEQIGKLWHVSNLFLSDVQIQFAENLTNSCFADRVFFCNSGAEALETCIKMARRFHFHNGDQKRTHFITYQGAFHGRTMATLAATGREDLSRGFAPLPEGFQKLSFGSFDETEAAVNDHTAGIIVEPIQGEGGVRVADRKWMQFLRDLCDRKGIVLILDEVQCGMGRTGKLYAHMWSGIVPDIMALAKGIGGGFPLGACLATEKVSQGMSLSSHGSTFGGNALAMVAGNAVLSLLQSAGVLEGVQVNGDLLRKKMLSFVKDNDDIVCDARGLGLLQALVCRKPNQAVAKTAREEHFLVAPAGENTIRLLPPLNVTVDEFEFAFSALDRASSRLREQSDNAV
jgi:acetylornithine/N-succinyldiaminopimelate aminotransferase